MTRTLAVFALAASALACSHPALLPPKAMELNRAGAVALANGDLTVAEARVALALEYNPRFTEAWVNLGIIEMRRGNFEKAIKHFVKARDLNPDLPAPHHALGLLAETEHDPKSAEAHYRAALKVDPGFPPARVNLARLLFARGDYDQAREHFLRLTQVAPDFVEGWSGLCDSLLRLDRAGEAADVHAEASRYFPGDPHLELIEARLLLHRNELAAAEEKLSAIAARASGDFGAAVWAWLAVARVGRRDLAGGRIAAERALAANPNQAVARYALGLATRASEMKTAQ